MRHRRLRDSNATDTADTASSTASTDSTDSIMSDEEQQTRSRRSSVSSASSASSEQFARDIAVMADKVDAAEALAKLAKDNYLIANQEFKGYSTALNNKLKEQKKLKAQLVARAAQVKAAGDDPQVVEIATAIKNTGRMQGIIQRLKDQEITGEKAIEYIDLAMEQAVIVLESDMVERAAYGHAKDETAQAQAHFDQSRTALLQLEAKKKLAEEKLDQLRNDQIELTDPVLDDEASRGSNESLTGGASLFSGIEPATDLKPPPRKRRATDGLAS